VFPNPVGLVGRNRRQRECLVCSCTRSKAANDGGGRLPHWLLDLTLSCRPREEWHGKVYAVDPYAEFSLAALELLEYITPVKEDALQWTPPGTIDFLFENGTHEPGFTKGIWSISDPLSVPRQWFSATTTTREGWELMFHGSSLKLLVILAPHS
jgi:hypothetical protein